MLLFPCHTEKATWLFLALPEIGCVGTWIDEHVIPKAREISQSSSSCPPLVDLLFPDYSHSPARKGSTHAYVVLCEGMDFADDKQGFVPAASQRCSGTGKRSVRYRTGPQDGSVATAKLSRKPKTRPRSGIFSGRQRLARPLRGAVDSNESYSPSW